MNELTKRILVAIVGIPLSFLIIFYGGWFFAIFIIILTLMTADEFSKILEKKDIFINKPIVYFSIISILGIFQYSLPSNLQLFIVFSIILILSLSVILPGLELWKKNNNPTASIASSFLTISYICVAFLSLLIIRNFDILIDYFNLQLQNNSLPENWGAWLVISIFVTIWVCDSAAYFVGSAFGKRKLFPRHSPKKSWEGAIGGFIGSVLTFVSINYYVDLDFSHSFAILSGTVIGIAGQIGDLTESQFKREMQVKDSSNLIPGHGGIFDRFDSIIFVSPLMLILLILNQII